MARHTKQVISNYLQCSVSQERNPRRQAPFGIVFSTKRFQQVVFAVQTKKPRTENSNLKELAIVDVLSGHVCAKVIPDNRGDTIARALTDK